MVWPWCVGIVDGPFQTEGPRRENHYHSHSHSTWLLSPSHSVFHPRVSSPSPSFSLFLSHAVSPSLFTSKPGSALGLFALEIQFQHLDHLSFLLIYEFFFKKKKHVSQYQGYNPKFSQLTDFWYNWNNIVKLNIQFENCLCWVEFRIL